MSRARKKSPQTDSPVSIYKMILQRILEQRPSGTRQSLATVLGKNRSFISQISNPNYTTPIPAEHLGLIFKTCHFSNSEMEEFLDKYHQAHPGKPDATRQHKGNRTISIQVPDYGDHKKNQELEKLINIFARSTAKLMKDL